MIDQQELPVLIEQEIPELSNALGNKDQCANAYRALHLLRDYTRTQVNNGDMNAVKRCFKLVDKMYTKGNDAVKNAVENVYVYSFSHFLFHDDDRRKLFMRIVPLSLYTLYVKQMLHSHL
jgi:hypothetical protein